MTEQDVRDNEARANMTREDRLERLEDLNQALSKALQASALIHPDDRNRIFASYYTLTEAYNRSSIQWCKLIREVHVDP
jgi:hypothetical protein